MASPDGRHLSWAFVLSHASLASLRVVLKWCGEMYDGGMALYGGSQMVNAVTGTDPEAGPAASAWSDQPSQTVEENLDVAHD